MAVYVRWVCNKECETLASSKYIVEQQAKKWNTAIKAKESKVKLFSNHPHVLFPYTIHNTANYFD